MSSSTTFTLETTDGGQNLQDPDDAGVEAVRITPVSNIIQRTVSLYARRIWIYNILWVWLPAYL